jgi:hypothetical protein
MYNSDPSPLSPVFISYLPGMASSSSSDVIILGLGVALAALYLFRDQLFAAAKPKAVPLPTKVANGSGNPRDFIAKMKEGVRLKAYHTSSMLTPSSRKNAL